MMEIKYQQKTIWLALWLCLWSLFPCSGLAQGWNVQLFCKDPAVSSPPVIYQPTVEIWGEVQSPEPITRVVLEVRNNLKQQVVSQHQPVLYFLDNSEKKNAVFKIAVQLKPMAAQVVCQVYGKDGLLFTQEWTPTTSYTNAGWESDDFDVLAQVKPHQNQIRSLAFTRDNRYLITASDDRTVKVLGVPKLNVVRTFKGHQGYVHAVAVTPNSRFCLSGSEDQTIILWDLNEGRLATLTGCRGGVTHLAITPDGKYAISASKDLRLRLWDLEKRMLAKSFSLHTAFFRAMDLSADGKFVVTADEDNQVIVWDIAAGAPKLGLKSKIITCPNLRTVAIHPSNRYIYAGTQDAKIKTWRSLLNPGDSVWEDANFILWEEQLKFTKNPEKPATDMVLPDEDHEDPIFYMKVSPAGEHLLVINERGAVLVYELFTFAVRCKKYTSHQLTCGALSHDNGLVAVGDFEGEVFLLGKK